MSDHRCSWCVLFLCYRRSFDRRHLDRRQLAAECAGRVDRPFGKKRAQPRRFGGLFAQRLDGHGKLWRRERGPPFFKLS
jgi:hypothetical protein